MMRSAKKIFQAPIIVKILLILIEIKAFGVLKIFFRKIHMNWLRINISK